MKINKCKNTRNGFTLIELLVVITIIAILASLATPMVNRALVSARMIEATNNARSIFQACSMYSGDEGGGYPRGEGSSNLCFRELFPDYLETEKIFFQQGSFFSTRKPDEKIGDETDSGDEVAANQFALEKGENHWAYVNGLSEIDKSSTPIIADGFTATASTYDDNHVWWKVKKAIIVTLDGAATKERITKGGIVRKPGKSRVNRFSPSETGKGEVLNPLL